jgi:hypothetical protein
MLGVLRESKHARMHTHPRRFVKRLFDEAADLDDKPGDSYYDAYYIL